MSQAYSDPKRESEPYSLPDIEVFYSSPMDDVAPGIGWYWWSCFPGCLPDGDPMGPFDTKAEALADARNGIGDDEDDNA
jgi:hypothetical protein